VADTHLRALAEKVLQGFRARDGKIATAESCTGGLLSAVLTSIPGSSDVFDRGFVTYSNQAKQQMIGVQEATLEAHGAVSGEVAREMASGALNESGADAAVAITGIAGPGGGTPNKPVGLVFIAIALSEETGVYVEEFRFGDISRDMIREKTVENALEMLCSYALDDPESE
jgi:nicotinamide-nucleotide amidase